MEKDDVRSSTWFDLVGPAPERMTRLTNDPYNIRQKKPNSDIRKHFFSNRIINEWNMLPSDVKCSKNVQVFKRHIERLIKH